MGWPAKLDDKKPVPQEMPDGLLVKIDNALTRYPNKRAALIPVLHLVQDHFGYISEAAMVSVGNHLELAPSYVADIVSFYSMLRTRPVGNYHIELCHTLSCALLGADSLADYLAEKLGIGFGEVTSDGEFSLGKVECIGACEQAPAMLVNNELYGNLNKQRIDQIIERLK